jgi:hypothetical protein
MISSCRNRFLAVLALVCTPLSIFGGPKIAVDTADINYGTIMEGQVASIKHVFKIKNTGDSVLLIKSVKAG